MSIILYSQLYSYRYSYTYIANVDGHAYFINAYMHVAMCMHVLQSNIKALPSGYNLDVSCCFHSHNT